MAFLLIHKISRLDDFFCKTTLLFKVDDPDNPENYRPFSVTTSLSKIF